MKCKVCGANFELKVDNHYISRDEIVIRTGISAIVGSNSEVESKLYDTFDCPVCGCQNVMQERKRIFVTKEDIDELQVIPKCFGEYDEMCKICDVMEACKKETETMEEE